MSDSRKVLEEALTTVKQTLAEIKTLSPPRPMLGDTDEAKKKYRAFERANNALAGLEIQLVEARSSLPNKLPLTALQTIDENINDFKESAKNAGIPTITIEKISEQRSQIISNLLDISAESLGNLEKTKDVSTSALASDMVKLSKEDKAVIAKIGTGSTSKVSSALSAAQPPSTPTPASTAATPTAQPPSTPTPASTAATPTAPPTTPATPRAKSPPTVPAATALTQGGMYKKTSKSELVQTYEQVKKVIKEAKNMDQIYAALLKWADKAIAYQVGKGVSTKAAHREGILDEVKDFKESLEKQIPYDNSAKAQFLNGQKIVYLKQAISKDYSADYKDSTVFQQLRKLMTEKVPAQIAKLESQKAAASRTLARGPT